MANAPNADQIAYWNSEAGGEKWAHLQTQIDEVFAPITDAVIELAAPGLGEQALDIGCGCGATTIALSHRVGTGGTVLGVDVSEPMLAVAERRFASEGILNAETVRADAALHPFAPATIDLALSRFGVMFFDDPAAAFANIRHAMKPGGRLAFACWRRMSDVPCFLVPFLAAKPHLVAAPPPDPDAPGPFAFADADRVRALLAAAGFSDVRVDRQDVPLSLGDAGAAFDFSVRLGPVSRVLGEAEPAARTASEEAIRAVMAAREGPAGIVLDAGLWLVSARA